MNSGWYGTSAFVSHARAAPVDLERDERAWLHQPPRIRLGHDVRAAEGALRREERAVEPLLRPARLALLQLLLGRLVAPLERLQPRRKIELHDAAVIFRDLV